MHTGNVAFHFDVGGIDTTPTFSCAHCNKVVFLTHHMTREERGGKCATCGRRICPACVAERQCDPLEAKLKRMERGA